MHVVYKKSIYLLLFITDCSESINCSIDRPWVTVCDNNWDMYRVCHTIITIVVIQELITKQTGEHTNYTCQCKIAELSPWQCVQFVEYGIPVISV